MSPETISDTYHIYIENRFWSTNGGLSREVADFTYELAIRLGVAKEKKPMETWITMEFVEKALEELGTYEPSTLSILRNPSSYSYSNLQLVPRLTIFTYDECRLERSLLPRRDLSL